jgi:hypothetical protein
MRWCGSVLLEMVEAARRTTPVPGGDDMHGVYVY